MAAEAIVSTVLEQLILIVGKEVVKEVRLVTDVRKEIEKLTSNFRAIRAVLIDAEQRQVQTEEETPVGVWLDKLKDASYDMDDVLDEWNAAILKLQIEGVENAQIPKKIAHGCNVQNTGGALSVLVLFLLGSFILPKVWWSWGYLISPRCLLKFHLHHKVWWMNEVASGNVTSLGVSSQSNDAAGEDSNEVEDVGLL
ncbi:hypothetical protein EZV62_003775 [Acer yangbiense]|uniref:Disease resistance N-terminal domain-containing protein n=1 Tax=Acer yangbiense TaxID=1000413 RepID=A0A5C7IHQ8_9ROSI|nr:hypothetical protein EZV62_003775 [Acer yangbiense]